MNKSIIERIFNLGLIPIVKIDDIEKTTKLSACLYKGGLDCIEVTYRTKNATEAIKKINEMNEDILVCAGTVSNLQEANEAINAGAKAIFTPGLNEKLITWCKEKNILIIPGVSTASEVEKAREYGLNILKFFPAEASGGIEKLKALSAVYRDIKFIPTGGINEENIKSYLNLENVEACGGTFMVDEEKIKGNDWEGIEKSVKSAIRVMLDYQLIHVGINEKSKEDALRVANIFCDLFDFKLYNKPRSYFGGRGFEIMHKKGYGKNGHIGIYTAFPEKAIYQLKKKGIKVLEETVTRNKKTNRVNLAYLDLEISGFAIHLINPDVKM
ncbi:bifunctional 4-hydroxy-2-oxoglutarate aldolase/2-dehydro-3-deoxy-phosphogluconate aldolase [Sneathia sanguinegens]|uniref:Bifunctional 4-hydroxy-2-oxoglutarate aldolase/2-dehydro-3-deoxy-phosphogluconate aldolase n=1 Tax=Sneathia sanguinegens TaxID=40543 RepID=A0ABT7HKA7_9FUSO|nr:bifunctional 4-hydroxy-2-oxoglutarate aldolase/2-dehydro-3-deoxy-phosphogluconate aldolase [Sneathia sanguinegens]MDK9580080.1 bifunctional 4-hydroxy-2-oxoglutarate aldolase/2-dehydro-3-deoxy-phosphogluconate aldolase [Sneathia sanguinegens]